MAQGSCCRLIWCVSFEFTVMLLISYLCQFSSCPVITIADEDSLLTRNEPDSVCLFFLVLFVLILSL